MSVLSAGWTAPTLIWGPQYARVIPGAGPGSR